MPSGATGHGSPYPPKTISVWSAPIGLDTTHRSGEANIAVMSSMRVDYCVELGLEHSESWPKKEQHERQSDRGTEELGAQNLCECPQISFVSQFAHVPNREYMGVIS